MSDAHLIRTECWKQALYAYGTAYIFNSRSRRLRVGLRILRFFGLALPASVGFVAVSFGLDSPWTGSALTVAAVLGLLQFLVSVWAQVANWEDEFAYATSSVSANNSLSERFQELGRDPPTYPREVQRQFRLIRAEASARSDLDNRKGITDREKRMGMRAALWRFQRACATCEAVPASIRPSGNCGTCGRF